MTSFAEIVAAVQGATNDPRTQATLYYACGAESGCQSVQQSNGPAQGPWQIEPGQGVSSATAFDPAAAAKAFLSGWNVQQNVDAQGNLWNTDPVTAAHNAALASEKPAQDYSAAQQQTAAGFMAQGVAAGVLPSGNGGNPVSGFLGDIGGILGTAAKGLPGVGPVIGAAGGVASTASTVADFLGNITALASQPAFWIRVVLVIGGVFGILVGLSGLAHTATNEISSNPAVSTAAMAA